MSDIIPPISDWDCDSELELQLGTIGMLSCSARRGWGLVCCALS